MTLLATSRQPLEVPGEVAWRVPSLSAPTVSSATSGAGSPEGVMALRQYGAVELFIDRAGRARRDFAVTNENAAAVAEICHRLDGIPLAIELAAARVRVLSPRQICDGLAQRFTLLVGGARTLLPRRLSVFAGGFDLDGAEAVGYEGALDLLTSLVDRSLVTMDDTGGAARYRLLETVRQYAAGRLAEAGEEDEARDRQLELFVALAERVGRDLHSAPSEAFPLLQAEHANLRAASDWAQ